MTKHILLTMVWAGLATTLPLPISPIAVYYMATINKYNTFITILVATLTDTIIGYLTYKLFLKFNYTKFNVYTKPLLKLGIRGEFTHVYLNTSVIEILNDRKTQAHIQKYGVIALFLAAATPLPFTLILYASGIVKYNKPKTLIITLLIGRAINYILMWLVGIGLISIF